MMAVIFITPVDMIVSEQPTFIPRACPLIELMNKWIVIVSLCEQERIGILYRTCLFI